ncbi:MAG TPA: DUF1080 domain-containing protein [Mycobacteriales bacterium]|nr:DUF1080 domain-containing protein [Mycobacteriales bacterium]
MATQQLSAASGLRLAVVALLALGVLAPGAARASSAVTFRGPSAYGVVHFGQRVQAELTGACGRAVTRVRVVADGHALDGRAAKGCLPVVEVPTETAARAAGFRDGAPVQVSLVSGRAVLPLRFWRVQPQTAAAGAPTPVQRVEDPREHLHAMRMGAGDALDLGRVELSGLQSVDVRNLVAGTGLWELRVSDPTTGRAIARGELGSAGSLTSAGDAGWFHAVAPLQLRPAEDLIGDANTFGDLTPATGEAPHLYLVVVAVLDTEQALVNWVDLNGPGVGLPHRFTGEHGFTTLFDGSSLDGWRHVGPGRFVLRDGAMRAEHRPQDRGWAWEWYSLAQYSDFVLRLRFKVESWEDNGGVLLRHADPLGDPNRATDSADEVQVQEGFENLTGGIAHSADAYRLATGMVGQWNDLEVVARGPVYVVRINGTEVQRFRSAQQTRGFLAVENEQLAGTHGGHIWYDDIRVHRCLPQEAACAA